MDRQLINYLPYQVREFQEYKGIAIGEQPEFELAWDHWQEVFDNQFIDTAKDYGLSRWEKMLHITPKATDTLESRRIRIKSQLNNFTPYTFRVFMQMMNHLANGELFQVFLDPGSYLMRFLLEWGANGKIEALEWLIEEILPANIAIDAKNELQCTSEGVALLGGGVCFVEMLLIPNDGRDRIKSIGSAITGGGVIHTTCDMITYDSREIFALNGGTPFDGEMGNSVMVTSINNFNQFTISSENETSNKVVATEITKINSDEKRTDS